MAGPAEAMEAAGTYQKYVHDATLHSKQKMTWRVCISFACSVCLQFLSLADKQQAQPAEQENCRNPSDVLCKLQVASTMLSNTVLSIRTSNTISNSQGSGSCTSNSANTEARLDQMPGYQNSTCASRPGSLVIGMLFMQS